MDLSKSIVSLMGIRLDDLTAHSKISAKLVS